jgi:hypothetical protein
MAQLATPPIGDPRRESPPVTSADAGARASFVEWGAVAAGAILAAALSFVFLGFGTAIGLSAVSPWPNTGLSAKVVASLAVFWVLAQQIGAFLAGGYVAGRMRSRWREASEHEIEFRDGLHGGLVWGLGVVIGAGLLMAAAAATTGALSGRSSTHSTTHSTTLASAGSDAMDLTLDRMLRPTIQAAAPAASAQAGAERQHGAATADDETRAEMSRLLKHAVATSSMGDQDRNYLAHLVAQHAGVTQQEAEKRVDTAIDAARTAANTARHAGILTGFVTAASLIIAFGAAWWGAIKGGKHRDSAVPARFVFAERRRSAAP